MQKNTYGVDVARPYQPVNLSTYVANGAKFAIVKLTQGTYYKNPDGGGQIASAKANKIEAAGYFYATHGNNVSEAVVEAQYAVNYAVSAGLPKGSIIADDFENGSGNYVSGDRAGNTNAVLAAMDTIKKSGYQPMLYSGAAILKNNLYINSVLAKYPNSLWVASYPTMGRIDSANMNYFPSMDGVAIWQFTDNWKGMSVDGNICVLDTKTANTNQEEDDEMNWHPEVKLNDLGQFKTAGATIYSDDKLNKPTGKAKANTYKIYRATNGAVNAGGNQWFSQADGITKINPLAVNPYAHGICKILTDDAYTQNETKPDAKGIKHLPKGSTWNVMGRSGKYLLIGSEKDGKWINSDKAVIVL